MTKKLRKIRTKKYRPKAVERFPAILLNGETFEDLIAKVEQDMRSGFIALFLGAADRESYARVIKGFLLGELLSEHFIEETDLREIFEACLLMLVDACTDAERGEAVRRDLLTEAENKVPLLLETIRRSALKDVLQDMSYLQANGGKAVRFVFEARRMDLEAKNAEFSLRKTGT